MNTATFVGYTGKDAKLEKTSGGKSVASFSLAIDNGRDEAGKPRDPTWIKGVLWQQKADSLAQYITKGRMLAVSGPVSVETWIDKHGTANAVIVVTVRELTFCGPAAEKAKAA